MTLANCVLAGLLFLVTIYCCFLLVKNRSATKRIAGLVAYSSSSDATIKRNWETIKSLEKFKKAVKIKQGDITVYKLIEFKDGVLDIEKINSISGLNISKFLKDNPKIAKQHEEKIRKNFEKLAKANPYPTSFRGEIISGRENILKIFGEDIANLFFIDFVDQFKEHFELLLQSKRALNCSFK